MVRVRVLVQGTISAGDRQTASGEKDDGAGTGAGSEEDAAEAAEAAEVEALE
jgi:hypothetical protein